jgi:serine/threonine protein kinase
LTPERWRQIEELYHAAVQRPANQRDALLAQADPDLRRQVEILLAESNAGSGPDRPAPPGMASDSAHSQALVLAPGSKLGHFEIVSLLGRGGMGEVYRARDSRLKREVAIKVLPEGFARDPERIARLEREARAVAALNHPHICQLYDVGPGYLVMELVEGQRLKGPMSVAQAVEYAVQILDALDAAHRNGITHRDLKPANILVTKQGIKLLDFGLAKQAAGASESDATRTATLTAQGQIIGTAHYIAPERLQGQEAEARSDLFSFGCVLYEMLAGKRAFEGPSTASVLAAILEHEPPPLQVAPALERVVRKCLAKDPEERFQTARDLKYNLLLAMERPLAAPAAPRLWTRRWALGVTAILALAVVTSRWLYDRLSRPPEAALEQLESDIGVYDDPSLSSDGRVLAFTSDKAGHGNLEIWVKHLNTRESRRLTGSGADADEPTVSADGEMVAYRSERDGGSLYTISTLGGEARRLAPGGHHPRFSPDGRFLAYWTGEEGNPARASARSYVISVTGEERVELLPDFADCRFPVWSPDGKSLLVTATQDRNTPPAESMDWWLVAVKPAGSPPVNVGFYKQIREQNLRLAKDRHLRLAEYPPHWAGDSVVFAAGQGETHNIWQVGLDRKGRITTQPKPLTSGTTWDMSPWSLDNGTVAFVSADYNQNIWSAALGTSQPKLEQETRLQNLNQAPHVSADGRLLLFTRRTGQARSTWILDRTTGKVRELRLPDNAVPVLSRDGTKVVCSVETAGKQPLIEYQIDSAQTAPKTLCDDCGPPWDWSFDGTHILYQSGRPEEIGVLDLSSRSPAALIRSPGHSYISAALSPDQNRLAFVDRIDSDHARIQIAWLKNWTAEPVEQWTDITSEGFNDKPTWSADGRTLYYHSTRDSFGCIWARRFDAKGRPSGTEQEVLPLHSARLSSSLIARPSLNLAIGGSRLFVNLEQQTTSTLWLWRPRAAGGIP